MYVLLYSLPLKELLVYNKWYKLNPWNLSHILISAIPLQLPSPDPTHYEGRPEDIDIFIEDLIKSGFIIEIETLLEMAKEFALMINLNKSFILNMDWLRRQLQKFNGQYLIDPISSKTVFECRSREMFINALQNWLKRWLWRFDLVSIWLIHFMLNITSNLKIIDFYMFCLYCYS